MGWSWLAGLVVGVPSGWLLAYLAALPFFLGLFFFVLMGLIVGAVVFRVGSKAPVPSAQAVWAMGLTVSAALVFSSLWAEYRAMPRSVEKKVRESYYESFTAEKRAELGAGVRDYVSNELRTSYPPGGFLGYLRWAATNGTFTCPRILKPATVKYQLLHRRMVWVARVSLSCLLAGWAIMSQVLALRAVQTEQPADDPEPDPASGSQGAP
jgi:hypothetical protein